MAVIVKNVELTWVDRTYVVPVAKGMIITIKHFLKQLFTRSRNRFTVQYPDWKREPAPGYRGLHELKRFESGAIKCVACFMCAEACPARCITIEADEFGDLNKTQGFEEKRPRVFKIDMLRCIYCGLCEEVCPEQAIFLKKQYALTGTSRAEMMHQKAKLVEMGGLQQGVVNKWNEKK